jgi:hypothetical protein
MNLEKLTLHVYISHYVSLQLKLKRSKIEFISTLLFHLSQIGVKKLDLNIFSNTHLDYFDSISQPVTARNDGSLVKIHVVPPEELLVSGNRIDWLITWSHKKTLIEDVSRNVGQEDHFYLYLEDDALFTESNLRYFIEYLPKLRKLGLVPGFRRVEWGSIHNTWTLPDAFSVDDYSNEVYDYPFSSKLKLVQPKNPYSASFLLDQELGEEYISSESSNLHLAHLKHPIIYDIGSTAALGVICEKVPIGYKSRTAVLYDAGSLRPLPCSLIRHQGDKYANDPWQFHFPVFSYQADRLIVRRTLPTILKRLLSKDGHIMVKRLLRRILKRS